MKKISLFSLGDVRYLETQTRQDTGTITHKDVLIMRLKTDLQLSKEHQKSIAKQLQDCETSIGQFQAEIEDLQDALSLKISELKNKDQSIEIIEKQYRETKERV